MPHVPLDGPERQTALAKPEGELWIAAAVAICRLRDPTGSPHDVALRLGLGRATLYRLFDRFSPWSPLEFLHFNRVYSAARWLVFGTMTMKEVARAARYSSVRSFERQFHRIAGVPPQDFAKQHSFDWSTRRPQGPYFEREDVRYLFSPDFIPLDQSSRADPAAGTDAAMSGSDARAALAWKLLRYRTTEGVSLEDLADKLGIGSKHLGEIERGRRRPSLELFARIARAISLPETECERILGGFLKPLKHPVRRGPAEESEKDSGD